MLVIYDFSESRCFAEATAVAVDETFITIEFSAGESGLARINLGEGWTKDEAVKAVTAQLYDEELGEPCRPTVTLVHIQQPYPKPIQF